jgi:branched-chain amino acid transport system substrate-binding protein
VVAHVGPFSGPLAVNGEANYVGAKAYFDAVNAEGGIGGRRIRFVREDDAYKPEETVRLLRLVAERDKPVAFVNMLGSANAAAVLKVGVLAQLGVPIIGLTPGSEALREPGSPFLFHLQAGDRAQLRAILQHLAITGMSRLAVAYQDNPFGKTGLAFIETQAAERGMSVVATASMPIGAEDAKEAAAAVQPSGAQACIMVLAPNSGAAFVRDVRSKGAGIPIYGLSYVPADLVVARAGAANAAGVALAQVTPNPNSDATRLMRDFHGVLQRHAAKGTIPSSMSLQGYLAARVAVEAIRRSGGSSAMAVESALRGLRLDFGGYTIDYTDGSNVGSSKVDIGVIDRQGRLRY